MPGTDTPAQTNKTVLDARYEQLRHTALHQRGQAFSLGFGVLRRGGVTVWRRAVTALSAGGPTNPPATPSTAALDTRPPTPTPGLPPALATELIHLLAAVALAGTSPEPQSDPERSARVHRDRGVEGHRRALEQDCVAVCPPVHHPPGAA